jgi:hypothetical protein
MGRVGGGFSFIARLRGFELCDTETEIILDEVFDSFKSVYSAKTSSTQSLRTD